MWQKYNHHYFACSSDRPYCFFQNKTEKATFQIQEYYQDSAENDQ